MEPLQSSLLAKLAQVPDIRCKHGQRFAWSYLLAILTAGLAAGQTTILDLADWAQQHAAELIAQLQPRCRRIPSASTLRRVIRAADALTVEQQVAEHNQALDAADSTAGSVRALNGQVLRGQAVDGKDVRGVRLHGNPYFLVSLVRHRSAYVLSQAVVDEKTNEIRAVPALLVGRDLHGTVTTMDALLTQEAVLRQILAQHGQFRALTGSKPTIYIEGHATDRHGEMVFLYPAKLVERIERGKAYIRLDGAEDAEPVRIFDFSKIVLVTAK